jgi:hypothetical protein
MKLMFAFAAGSIGVWEPGCGKGVVRSLGRGNEQDARFTMLRDSETPRSESKQREQVGASRVGHFRSVGNRMGTHLAGCAFYGAFTVSSFGTPSEDALRMYSPAF